MLECMPLNLWITLSEGYGGSKEMRKKVWRGWVMSGVRGACVLCVCVCLCV